MRGGLADDVDHRGRRDVVVDAELQDARVEIAVREHFEALARDDGVRQHERLIVEAAHPRGAPTHALDDAEVLAGMENVAYVEGAFQVQRDPTEKIAERVLKRESDDRRHHGAPGERRLHVVIKDQLQSARAEDQVDGDGHDLAEQLRRDHIAPARHEQIENKGVRHAHDEDDQSDPSEEVERVRQRAADVAVRSERQRLFAEVVERKICAKKDRAENQRDEVRQNFTARSHFLALPLPPFGGEAQHVFDADEEVYHTETGDEAAYERIAGQNQQGRRGVEDRIHGPHARPRHDDEKEARLEAVEREEQRNRHSRGIVSGCGKWGVGSWGWELEGSDPTSLLPPPHPTTNPSSTCCRRCRYATRATRCRATAAEATSDRHATAPNETAARNARRATALSATAEARNAPRAEAAKNARCCGRSRASRTRG